MKRGREEEGDQLDMVNCLMLLNKVGEIETNPLKDLNDGAFKCKTCNRKFSSFQALGGHRASHKKTKLLVSDLSSCHTQKKLASSTTRMHPCPICGHEFAIGQALGGHMRKHRAAINHGLHSLPILKKMKEDQRSNLCLDLNLAPPANDLNKLNLYTPALELNWFI